MKVEQANIDKQKALSTLSTYENKLTDIYSELKKLDNNVTELKTVI
ncbi:hypothetical protein KYI78_14380 [Providencia rettgeri]|nr:MULTISPECIES: hypothetical protein [Providencia]MBW3106411.1 hypothetical protein [Providencia rettgeri]